MCGARDVLEQIREGVAAETGGQPALPRAPPSPQYCNVFSVEMPGLYAELTRARIDKGTPDLQAA